MTMISDCPFCGCGLEFVSPEYYVHPWNEGCPLSQFEIVDEPESIAAWNTRTSPPPSGEAGEVTIDALLNAYDAETATVPLGHEHIGRGRSTYNWRREVVRELRELSKALPTIKEPTDGPSKGEAS